MDKKEWKEFAGFFVRSDRAVPTALSRATRDRIRGELQPSAMRVSLRLVAVHVFAGGLTLTLCPQFGVGPLGGGEGLMGFFMQFGHWACALFCGSFFMGTTALAGQLALSRPERAVVARQGWWQFSGLAVVSMIALMLWSGPSSVDWSFGVVWLGAAVIVGFGLFVGFEKGRLIGTRRVAR